MADNDQNTPVSLGEIASEALAGGSTGAADLGAGGQIETTTDTGQAAPPAAPPPPANPELAPPEFWQPQAREAWKALHGYQDGYGHLKTLHDQFRHTHGLFTKTQQELAGIRRQFEPINEVLSSRREQWQREGISEQQALGQLFYWDDKFRSDPQAAVLELARELGVDLQALTEAQPWVDPQTQALQAEVRELRRLEEERARRSELEQQAATQQQQQAVISQVETWAQSVGADGKPLYPHFGPDVLADMLHAFTRGYAKTPDEAYQYAMQWHPEGKKELAKKAEAEALAAAQAAAKKTQALTSASGKDRTPVDRGNTGGKPTLDDAVRAVIRGT